MFGSGDKNINFKGGKPHCKICNKLLTNYNAIYCQKHYDHKKSVGKHHSDETKKKQSIARKLNPVIRKGKDSNLWRGGITDSNLAIRNSSQYDTWRRLIFERDSFTCETCKKVGGKLEAHHIKRFSKIIFENNITSLDKALLCEELWNPNNGITLCEKCHDLIHSTNKK